MDTIELKLEELKLVSEQKRFFITRYLQAGILLCNFWYNIEHNDNCG